MPHVDYGNDTECVSDLTFARRRVDGETMMAQAMARRLTTGRGTLFYAPEYGYDLRQFLRGSVPAESVLNGNIENELLKDERVEDVTVESSYNAGTEALSVRAQGFGADGPFDLTIEIGAVTVKLLREGVA